MKRLLDRRLIVFAITGVIATLAYAALAGMLVNWAGLDPVPAAVIAYLLATLVSYAGNTLVGFRQRIAAGSMKRFYVVSAIGLVLTLAITTAGERMALSPGVTILLVAATLPALSFAAHILWTYRPPAG